MAKGIAILCTVFLFMSLAACTADNQAGDGRDNGLHRTGARDSQTEEIRYQRNDGDNNFSKQNPHIRVGDPNPRTVEAETRRMERAAENVDGVEDATVVIAGGNAFVRIDIARDVHKSRAPALEEEVAQQLFDIIPRYQYRVTTDGRLFNQLINR